MSDLTAEQQLVVDSRDAQITVRAAAGSGKTKTLVARYLRHVVDDGLRPDQILTITYTRKAAAEMKKRIVKELKSGGLHYEAQVAETGPIQTIHGFCERLLRENSVTAGIDPRFDVLDEGIAATIRHDALRRELQEDEGERPLVEEFLRLRAAKREYRHRGAMHEAITDDVTAILGKLRGASKSRSELEAMYADPEVLTQLVVDDLTRRKSGVIVDKLNALLDLNAHGPKAENERVSITQACGLMQIALGVWARIEHEMERRQAFDFAELERRAVNLVENNELTAAKLRRQYRAALVDEAQDLNPMQYRLLESLRIDQEMLVGDPQQSIYAFRQADYHRFVSRSDMTKTLQLSTNFRSRPEILEFIDTIFQDFWKTNYEKMSAASDQPGGVQLWSAEGYDRERVVEMVQSALAEGRKPGDIAILVRTLKNAKPLPSALLRVGIQSRVAGGAEDFYGRLHVRDLANTLQALADPEADLALLALFRSPIVGLSLNSIVLLADPKNQAGLCIAERLAEFQCSHPEEQEKLNQFLAWFEPLQKIADRLSAWEVISEILKKSPYLIKIAHQPHSRQAIANIRKLQMLAVSDRELGPLEFAEKIRRIQEIKSREGDAPAVDDDENTVKIMTVHKSKGLEFPVVIVPDLFEKAKKTVGSVLVDQESGLIYPRFGKEESILYQWFKNQMQERERAEEERVLYVALTRAKEQLVVCANPRLNPRHEPFALRIARAIGMDKDASKWQVINPEQPPGN